MSWYGWLGLGLQPYYLKVVEYVFHTAAIGDHSESPNQDSEGVNIPTIAQLIEGVTDPRQLTTTQPEENPNEAASTNKFTRKGRYATNESDRHPNLPVSPILLYPTSRPGRIFQRRSGDPDPQKSFGDPLIYKRPGSSRFFFQNVKGLSSKSGIEGFRYYIAAMLAFSIDIFGMAETNTGWQHRHLQDDFRHCVKWQCQLGKAVFGYPTTDVDPLPINETFQAWILSLRQFLYNHYLSVKLTNNHILQLRGKHDAFIMSNVSLQYYTASQQRDIKLVRLYLQATTLADLTDASDKSRISVTSLTAQRSSTIGNKVGWPRQQTPSVSQRRMWRKYITAHYLRYNRWWKRSPIDEQYETSREALLVEPATRIPTMIKALPRTQKRMLLHIKQVASDEEVWKACRKKGKISIFSDGGLKENQGTFGWNIRSSTNEVLIEGAGPVDGPFEQANSTRSELGGYAASLLILSLLQQLWGVRHRCKFRWSTDSKAALKDVNNIQTELDRYPARQPSNADYLGIIRRETKAMKRKIKTQWVKGHQQVKEGNKSKAYQAVIGNNHADSLATWYCEQSGKAQSMEKTDHIDEAQVSISMNGIRLTGQVESSIRYHIDGYHLRMYIQSKHKWSNKTWNRIDMEVFGRFNIKLKPNLQLARTKFLFDQWHTGDRRIKTAKVKDPQLTVCPCCLAVSENLLHVMQCKENPDRDKSITAFRKAMSPVSPHPVFYVLKECILQWMEGEQPVPEVSTFPAEFQEMIQTAIADQNVLGWTPAIKGFLSVEWRHLASYSFLNTGDCNKEIGFQRMRKIIDAFNTLAQRLWKARNQH